MTASRAPALTRHTRFNMGDRQTLPDSLVALRSSGIPGARDRLVAEAMAGSVPAPRRMRSSAGHTARARMQPGELRSEPAVGVRLKRSRSWRTRPHGMRERSQRPVVNARRARRQGRTVSAVGNPPVDPDAFDAFEAAGWEEKAAAYERFFGVITGRVVEPLLAAASVGVGTRVLDVATGPGWVAAQAAERGASVVGVDVAEAMIARARSAHPGLEFRWADAHELPFADASFDAVVGNLAVMHLSRPERAMAEFARVLRPGGRLALTAWADPSQHRLAGVFLDAVAEARATPPADLPPGPDFFRFSDDEAFAAALRQQGLASARRDVPSRSCCGSPVPMSSGTACSARRCGCPRSSRASRRRSGNASEPRSIASRTATDVVTA